MGFRKLAKDDDGNTYVAERSVGDAVVKVVTFTTAKRGDIVYWPDAVYEVSVPNADPPVPVVQIKRRGDGVYDVPDKAMRVGLSDAVAIALGRMNPPPPAEWRGTVRPPRAGRTAGRDAGGRDVGSSGANVRPGSSPQVIAEPEDNWGLQQGDRIMRHLALYPEGVDPVTMSAGMHDVPTTKIRAHLKRHAKPGGLVVVVRNGIYARRTEQN